MACLSMVLLNLFPPDTNAVGCRYKDSSAARYDERPTSARPGSSDGYQLDVTRCRHVHKYVTRIKEVRPADECVHGLQNLSHPPICLSCTQLIHNSPDLTCLTCRVICLMAPETAKLSSNSYRSQKGTIMLRICVYNLFARCAEPMVAECLRGAHATLLQAGACRLRH